MNINKFISEFIYSFSSEFPIHIVQDLTLASVAVNMIISCKSSHSILRFSLICEVSVKWQLLLLLLPGSLNTLNL